ncbi:hypothetical protein DFH29DRAFT_1004035 [Suillus ampliporus]|nr:hypothetical protein DFH29DRAFT_1004035 [Suillus ampliporus]
MIIRIYAMYQRSKKMLVFLVVIFLASTIASGVLTVMGNFGASGEEAILSGIHMCINVNDADGIYLNDEIFIPTLVWEILVFCLAVWIVIKRFRELQHSPTGSTIGDSHDVDKKSRTVLHRLCYYVLYRPWLIVSKDNASVGSGVYYGVLQISQFIQMFVLGPRLILSVRESHVKTVIDEGTGMTTVAFQERGHMSTDGGV